MDALRSWSCEFARGFFLARPMTWHEIVGWLSARHRSVLRPVLS